MGRRVVYMDHAATTPLHPDVLEAMMPYMQQNYGNPSGIYTMGREARQAIDRARDTVANVLGCRPQEIVFTSGGTESDNTALKGTASAMRERGNHIITSSIEHHAVLHACHDLEEGGFEVTYLPVDQNGIVSITDLESAITDRTVLISVMLANNEIGTIQPVAEFARLIKEKARDRDIVVHTDAVQGAWALDLNVDKLGVDMLSLSAHKFQGPKGMGVLFLRKGTRFIPQQTGGAQEDNRRAGTENVAGIVGTAVALKLAAENRESNVKHCKRLRDRLVQEILRGINETRLNGHPEMRLPNNANIAFRHVEGESILLNLDLQGIAVSSGSACASGDENPSHVLVSIGLPAEVAHSSLRFTVGPGNTDEDVDHVMAVLPSIIKKLRDMSPLASQSRANRDKHD
ncbi:MAG: cysteine desulfurase NifS [Dehalococcoidia bacterium]|nr:MAG: cysteine desulfurase NifS [Dehalococcoidia bacterium]